jgi:hypothetical protein
MAGMMPISSMERRVSSLVIFRVGRPKPILQNWVRVAEGKQTGHGNQHGHHNGAHAQLINTLYHDDSYLNGHAEQPAR